MRRKCDYGEIFEGQKITRSVKTATFFNWTACPSSWVLPE